MDDCSITSDQAAQKIKNWQQCYSTELVKHFKKSHGLQFERLCSLELTHEAIKQVFAATSQTNAKYDFEIMMGLDSRASEPEQFTFRPILRSNHESDKYFEFQYIEPTQDVSQTSTKISYELFDWLSKNWREMGSELINDVFGAQLEDNSMARIGSLKRLVRKRLLGYHFAKNINAVFWDFINTTHQRIQKIIFHLGADMNKERHSDTFTFSPIFEVILNTDGLDEKDFIFAIHKLGLRSIKQDDGRTSVYYEYMSPCPSSCPT